MKKPLIVTVGIILILLILAAWAYLLFFGTPAKGSDVFVNLGFAPTTQPEQTTAADFPPATDQETITQINTEGALRQLTTRPIAGFSFVGTSSAQLRYVERGTGHIYEIDSMKGTEKKISGTTIPQVVEAIFSDSGNSIALVVESTDGQRVLVGRLSIEEEKVDYMELPSGAKQPSLMGENIVQYILTTTIGTEGYELNIDTGASTRVFSIPLRDIRVEWGDPTYVYNTPSKLMTGVFYEVGAPLTPLTQAAYGLTGAVYGDMFVWSSIEEDSMLAYARPRVGGETVQLPVSFIPEKCTHMRDSLLWCAAPFSNPDGDFLEAWYRGEVRSEDRLWLVDMEQGRASQETHFLQISGRAVDVDILDTDATGMNVLMRNKIDNTLWLYAAETN